MKIVRLPHGRLAIRDGDALLAVPPMRDDLPREVRTRVFDYVLRRQIGLAEMTVQIETEVMEGRERSRRRMAALLATTPHTDATGDAEDAVAA